MIKRFFRSRFIQTLLAILLASYMRLVKSTTRWRVEGADVVMPIWAGRKGVIGVLWHSRVLMTIAGWPMDKQHPSILISHSPDGAFIARATRMLGVGVIRGSAANRRKKKHKGGSAALRQMARHVETGGCMAITLDGPRGPRMHAAPGALHLARMTGAPIVCFGWSTHWAKVFNSWDHFMLPLPFGRGTIVWKGPVFVPKDADATMLEEKRLEVQALLRAATQEADRACGRTPMEPAAPRPS